MARRAAAGIQDFVKLREENYFYIDKTAFIREWWESGDDVTLITRPRRFGKTLTMSMLDCFFSVKHARSRLFEGLSVWEDEKYRLLQGTYPVISLSFALIKEPDFLSGKMKIYQMLVDLYAAHAYLMDAEIFCGADREFFRSVRMDMPEYVATMAIHKLSDFLYRFYGKKVIILLDEYDTPMQEAYVGGYWDTFTAFMRSLFNATFKTNPNLGRAVMTGITRVSKESVFSDLNNLKVVTTTSNKYACAFGFTEQEVLAALEEYHYSDRREEVKYWYDGFIFGKQQGIYNPWSILNFLATGEIDGYWANTSSNGLVSKLLAESGERIKIDFEALLKGGVIRCPVNEQVVYHQLDEEEDAIWSLLVASGYLKVLACEKRVSGRRQLYDLALTNGEVRDMFYNMVRGWFGTGKAEYNGFVTALLACDVEQMNDYMARAALNLFSYFDTGNRPSGTEPERFYHGFVLGLIVDLHEDYVITSNGESGFGRYDVMIEPKNRKQNAYILEFKVFHARHERSLQDTVDAAHAQIEERKYEAVLLEKGFPAENIHKYAFAFRGKQVLIG